jgi:hypothetical protein
MSQSVPPKRASLANALQQEEARLRRLEAEHTEATARAAALRAELAALPHAPVASAAAATSAVAAPQSSAEKVKSGHGRVIDLSGELTSALDRHLTASSTNTGRVFLQDSGRPALAQHLYAWTEAATLKAGIPTKKGVRLHVMRHSACSALAALGAPMIAIQSLAGHQSPQTTAKYMHLAAGVQAAAVRLFGPARGKDRGTR